MERTIATHQVIEETNRFFQKVYAWMVGGLVLSGLTAYGIATSPALTEMILGNQIILLVIILIELGLVIGLSGRVRKMSATTATFMFLLYCFMTGITLSVIFLVYTMGSIANIFLITAGMFAAISLYGMTTKADLTKFGHIMIMALFGIIIASVVNFFLHSAMTDYVISIIAVLVFSGLTAYDTQKLKEMNIIGNEGTDEDHKEAIMGALTLYLDFINLFLRLLRLFGKRK